MELRFAPLELASLSALKTELLCLPVFSDERPLRGAAGLADWRLCGRLSDLLVQGELKGLFDEALLLPPPEGRLAAERLLCLGAGRRSGLDEPGYRVLLRTLLARVLALRVRTIALALPHASVAWLSPAQAIDVLLEESLGLGERLDELVLVDTAPAQRAMEARIERARRRALLDL